MVPPSDSQRGSNRRDFLSGRSIRREIEQQASAVGDAILDQGGGRKAPPTGDTVRLATRAMACEFSIIMNPLSDRRQVIVASDALDRLQELEAQLTVYRETSPLLELNRRAASEPVTVEPDLFALLERALQISAATGGAFNPTARALNALWRDCRASGRIPSAEELQQAVAQSDAQAVKLDATTSQIAFERSGLGFDLGGMGKGYALDRLAEFMEQEGMQHFLIHGGHSSILARGEHAGLGGWPVGIRHPLFPQKRLATLILPAGGFSASGSGVQFFRFEGKRYGHIFDPRTGWPVDQMLTVAVTAPTAAEADALSTAFYVMGLEQAEAYCQAHPEIGALLIPAPQRGTRLEPVLFGIDSELLFWN